MASHSKLGCTHPKVERRSRTGVVDAVMFRLGRYPWVCRLCGCRLYFKDRRPGHGSAVRERPSRRPPAPAVRDDSAHLG